MVDPRPLIAGPLLVGPLLVGPLLVVPLLDGPLLVGPLFTYIQDHFIQSNRNNERFRKKRNQNNAHLSAVKIKGGVEIKGGVSKLMGGWVWKLKGG